MVGSPCVIFARLSDFTRTGNQSLRMVLPVLQGLRRYRSVAGTSENLLLSMRGLAARDNGSALTVGRAEVRAPADRCWRQLVTHAALTVRCERAKDHRGEDAEDR